MLMTKIFDKGGPVVLVLLVYSCIALALVIKRVLHYLMMEKLPEDFEQCLILHLQKTDLSG